MAKRRTLTPPSADDIAKLEEGFAAKPSLSPFATKSAAPIAKVAAEAAQVAGAEAVVDRVEAARDKADAEKWRSATAKGQGVRMIALGDIDAEYLRRDRMSSDEDEMQELLQSIRDHGLRAPIEVTATDDGYGLISGHRRLHAFRQLAVSDSGFGEIPAFVRDAGSGQDAYVSMVEENEVRANLTHYERGRIAVLATGQGVFPSVEAAVNVLFAAGSKAKRSKVRSFALVHENLGDLLRFPTALTEKAGLQLAAALRDGEQGKLRLALVDGAGDAKSEWRALEAALTRTAPKPRDVSKGGRPREITKLDARELTKGGTLKAEIGADAVRIELKGRTLNPDTVERLLNAIERQLS